VTFGLLLFNKLKKKCKTFITGLAVALTCYISHVAKYGKTADFAPTRKAKTPEPISMKLEIYDYV